MTNRENVSKLVCLLLDGTTTDENLVERVDGFLRPPPPPPVFPVKQETIRIVDADQTHRIEWEFMTTGLVPLGFEFGDVVRDGNRLRRIIAHDESTNRAWFTADAESDVVREDVIASGRFERYAPDDALRDRLSSILSDDDDDDDLADRVRAELRGVPRFAVAQNGLKIGALISHKVLGWDDMTVHLAERGLAFGDVVVDGTRNRLHRVVAYKDGKLWITSATTGNSIVFDDNPDHFEKQSAKFRPQ